MATDPPLTPANPWRVLVSQMDAAWHRQVERYAGPGADPLYGGCEWCEAMTKIEEQGAEAELLALRPVVEAAVAWRRGYVRTGAPITDALADAVDTYRGLSGRAVSGEKP